jgi:uncharacterized protein YdhG (YjbR/CyaY superfamily)
MPFKSHEEYFSNKPAEVRHVLEQIQKEIEVKVPSAARTISYNMPAFKNARTFIYFAAFQKHVGIYPPVTKDRALVKETQEFRGAKGNLSFPYAKGVPVALIGRVAVALAAEYAEQ